uniref:Uncharacterized protein n=1 Tax=Spongospora subterranea TaxID=70186 RepID=A0A0H5QND8_9EUKA|eukprot:CRZ03518.1 hypothetical protein [Spongospora subterranea]
MNSLQRQMVFMGMSSSTLEGKQRDRLASLLKLAKDAMYKEPADSVTSRFASMCSFYDFHIQILNVLERIHLEFKQSDRLAFDNGEVFWDMLQELTVVVSSDVKTDEFTKLGFALVVALLQYLLNMAQNKNKPAE